jgi:hypothetical protein
MKAKVFISKPNEGWSELIIPEEFQHYPYDRLVKKIYQVIKANTYKGFLITENPEPVLNNKQK